MITKHNLNSNNIHCLSRKTKPFVKINKTHYQKHVERVKKTHLTRVSLRERSSSAINSTPNDFPSSAQTRLASILALFLTPNWVNFSVPSPSFKTLPAHMRLIESAPQLDRFATSSLNMGTVHSSNSTSNTPAHVPAIFTFAIDKDSHTESLKPLKCLRYLLGD